MFSLRSRRLALPERRRYLGSGWRLELREPRDRDGSENGPDAADGASISLHRNVCESGRPSPCGHPVRRTQHVSHDARWTKSSFIKLHSNPVQVSEVLPMPKIIFQSNGLDAGEDVIVQTNDVMESLLSHFNGKLPDNTRIYHEQVSQGNDVTPSETCIEKDIELLQSLEGTVYVVTHPKFFLFGATGLLGTLLKVFVLGLISYLLRPKPPKERNQGEQSPNNGLSDRVNQARPKERIPDIYGQVRSTPDLLAKPYFVFEDQREIEYAYMCVGRGKFEITDVKDDITPIEDISGVSYAVYGPNTSPNSGSAQLVYGTAINERVWGARKSNAVNGQTLRAPNSETVNGDGNIAFNSPDGITVNSSSENPIDFEEYYVPGDNLTISNSVSGDNTIDLDGVYEILSVTSNSLVLANPGLVNPNWDGPTFNTDFSDAKLSSTSDKWVGWFTVEKSWYAVINLIAPQGIYIEDEDGQKYWSVGVQIESQRLDINEDPIGPVQVVDRVIQGSAKLKNERLLGIRYPLPGTTDPALRNGKWRVRVRRTTDSEESDNEVRYSDTVQWRDLYGLQEVTQDHFGNVTTIQVRTPATQGALSIKQRKFNCNAKRLIDRNALLESQGTTFDEAQASWGNEFGDISGWWTLLGTQEAFQSLRFRTRSYDGSTPTTIVARVYEGFGATAVLLQEKTVSWSELDSNGYVTVTFDQVIDNSQMLSFQWQADDGAALWGIFDGTTSGNTQFYTNGNQQQVAGSNPSAGDRVTWIEIFGENLFTNLDDCDAGLILHAVATDSKLGNMSLSELDTPGILAEIQSNKTYFGTNLTSKFNYTFDQQNTSAEEMLQVVARAVYCSAFRQGQLLKLHFEKQTDLSVLQFNHRNKIPNTELRSVRFGNSDDNDGVDLEWVDPEDGAVQTFQLPTDGSANNPKSIEISGITSEVQAYFHAWREFQKIVHRNVAVEFDATAEAITLTLNQKILVADNTRGDTWDGQVTYQDGVTLFLSQMFEGVDGTDYTIHLQHYDGQVEPLDIVAFGENNVTVASAPRLPLVIDNDKYANTTYIIVENNKKRPTAFLVQEVNPKDGMTVSLSAVNYDDRYYDRDDDIVEGDITVSSIGEISVV